MKFDFLRAPRPQDVPETSWSTWTWQLQNASKSREQFESRFALTDSEKRGFDEGRELFQVRATPYYLGLIGDDLDDPIRRMIFPQASELEAGAQSEADPLGEKRNSPVARILHRYPDRVLFLVTDLCSVYCRYCTRKHFTGQDQAMPKADEYAQALDYIRTHPGIREVILSGGDPLTLGDKHLARILTDLRAIDHVEIIRVGTRMPVVCPMRVTPELVKILRDARPVYLMTHFNHPRELTQEAVAALELLVDNGIPVMNQMVLLNGVNNHPAIVQALARRLLFLRVKPYYMFQCDPSRGTDHLRTSVEESLTIQRELWGTLSGLAMPTLSLDIPNGGGKTTLAPNFLVEHEDGRRVYRGWDGVTGEYVNPDPEGHRLPADWREYDPEWQRTREAKTWTTSPRDPEAEI